MGGFFYTILFTIVTVALALTAVACSAEPKKRPDEPDIFSNAVFQSQDFIYSGEKHEVTVIGVPDGTKITYSGNYAIEVGQYRAFAYLEKDGKNKVMTTTFNIKRADIEGVTFEDLTVTYDGNLKNIAVSGTVPEHVNVVYSMDGKQFTGAADAGVYAVTAELSGVSYNTLTLSATLTIGKADITGISFPDVNFVYDGGVKTAAVQGTLPDGTKVTYTNEDSSTFAGQTFPGTYKVNAVIEGANYKTLSLTAVLFIDRATITGITFKGYSAAYDALPHGIQIDGTLPDGVSVKYTLDTESGIIFENATEIGVYNVVATITGAYYKKLSLNATIIITAGRLTTVTGIVLDRSGENNIENGGKKGVILSWNPVPHAVSYDVYVSHTNGTNLMKFNVTGSNCDIKDKIFTTLCRDKYNIQIMAIPVSGDQSYAPSLLSQPILYEHTGRLYPPKNVKITEGKLTWDKVADAELYEIMLCLLDNNGAIIQTWKGVRSDSNSELVTEILKSYDSHNLPAGTYCFQIRAATMHNSFWVDTYMSDFSSPSTDTIIIS